MRDRSTRTIVVEHRRRRVTIPSATKPAPAPATNPASVLGLKAAPAKPATPVATAKAAPAPAPVIIRRRPDDPHRVAARRRRNEALDAMTPDERRRALASRAERDAAWLAALTPADREAEAAARARAAALRALREWAVTTFPLAFDKTAPRPLEIGVDAVLLEAARAGGVGSGKLIRKFISGWCRRRDYVAALAAPGAMRRRLDGTIAGEVTPEQQQAAQRRLAQQEKQENAK